MSVPQSAEFFQPQTDEPRTSDLGDLLDRPIAFYRVFVMSTGSVTGALMLSQAVYWSKRTDDAEGRFYKSIKEWESETGLTRFEQETARRRLRETGFWSEKLRGVPATVHFRIDAEKLAAALGADSGNPASQFAEIQQTSLRKSRKQACDKPASKLAENRQAIKEQRLRRDYTREGR